MITASRSSNPVSRLWRWGQRRRAVGRYLKILPRCLHQDYGHRGPYTPTQVEASIVRHRISSLRYVDLALALFCDPEHLRQLQREGGGTDYGAVRQGLASDYFGGDPDFTARDVARYSAEHGGGGHELGHSGDGGGHHGGVGGHH